jgi:mRNA-degrading endonuclease toxin of MazEF toxin-antitoxin module
LLTLLLRLFTTMNWLSSIKEGDILNVFLPRNSDPCKLSGEHPAVVISIDIIQETLTVVGCTSNSKYQKYGAVRIESTPAMPAITYARTDQGIRVITVEDIINPYNCKVTSELNLNSKPKPIKRSK